MRSNENEAASFLNAVFLQEGCTTLAYDYIKYRDWRRDECISGVLYDKEEIIY